MKSSEIIDLLLQAQSCAEKTHGISNILQPGIVKELIMAEILGHQLIPQKDLPDAKDESGNFYEYLASIRRVNTKTNKGCSFQMDRITKSNLSRVTRNRAFYFGIFKNHLEIEQVWIVEVPIILQEVERQLDKCKNEIAHVNFLLKWLETNGKLVYQTQNHE
ncbi:hypothetical protein LU293_04720 [Moraxella nasovis]|uniref:hypothetical protein n=1 Tax=Moraxella nasovis TaxID=2904121 RepID=UPI001F622A9A|nr:hypothetical protein [Moraxella nasovis]UNU74200.1 hypothetical protein LU293_04720 [Moraxella nasovis]